jgi:hypothetical protein
MKKLFPLLFIFFAACMKSEPRAGNVVIHSVTEYQSLTIKNNRNVPVDLANWVLKEEVVFMTSTTHTYTIPSMVLASGATTTFSSYTLGFGLRKPDTRIFLYDNNGNFIDEISWVSFR